MPTTECYTFRIAPDEPQLKQKQPDVVVELTAYVNASQPICDKEAYQTFVQGITDIIARHAKALTLPTPLYDKEIERIGKNELTFQTPWGGVAFKEVSVKGNRVEKLLIVEQGTKPTGVLGFEYHYKKDEHLKILEGYAIFIASNPAQKGQVILTFARPGDMCDLAPGIRHGIIPLTNLVVQETSTCELDREDLLFVF